MKLWGAVWGALIGWMVVPDFPPAGLIAGALAGLVAGVWLGNEVKNRATAMVREAVSELNAEMHAAIDQDVPREPRQTSRDDFADEIADALQPPAAAKRDYFGHQHLEGDALRSRKKAERQEQGEGYSYQPAASEQPCRQREAKDHHPHHRADADRVRQNAAARFDPRPAGDRRYGAPELEKGGSHAHGGGATGQQMDVCRDDCRRVN